MPRDVRNWPLAAKAIALGASCWILLATTLTLLGYVHAEQGLRSQAEAALTSDGQLVANAIDDWNQVNLKTVVSLARLPIVRRVMASGNQTSDVLSEVLDNAAASHAGTTSIGLLDLDGFFAYSSDPTDIGSPSRSQREAFTQALLQDAYVSGIAGLSGSTDPHGPPRVYYSAPVRADDGHIVGVLRSRVLLADVGDMVADARDRVGVGASGYLIDHRGTVIASSTTASGDAPQFADVLGLQQPRQFAWQLDGQDYTAVAVPLRAAGWTYVSVLPVSTIEAPAHAFLRDALLIAVIGLLLTMGVALLFARPMNRAIAQLTVAAKGLARGELDQDVDITSQDELGEMAEAFRQMVAYQQRMAGLADSVASGELNVDVQPQSAADRLGLALRDMVSNVRGLVQRLEDLAFNDSLTNLPNRAHFMDRLEHALARAERRLDSVAVLFLDIDNFKIVNDSLGHAAGDQLLVTIAHRVRACLRPADTLGRLGGDEFTVLLEDLADEADARAVASRVAEAVKEPLLLDTHVVTCTVSIGIALYSRGQSPGDLLRAADLALYAAKDGGKAQAVVFDASMGTSALRRLDLEAELRNALDERQLEVYYQPLIRLDDGSFGEVEALVRWNHPLRGIVSPAEFIPLAEETGLIVPLGHWVLETACRQTRAWQRLQPAGEQPLCVSVNLSAQQLKEPAIVEDVRRVLQQTGLDPSTLKLEITETVAVADTLANRQTLWDLRGLGVKLAIDDFGTGNSALNYLRRFPVETLKIDRSFVEELGRDVRSTDMVRGMIAFAKNLGLTVTGEGIETREQSMQLRAMGCDWGQGYLFARPVPAEVVAELLLGGKDEPLAA